MTLSASKSRIIPVTGIFRQFTLVNLISFLLEELFFLISTKMRTLNNGEHSTRNSHPTLEFRSSYREVNVWRVLSAKNIVILCPVQTAIISSDMFLMGPVIFTLQRWRKNRPNKENRSPHNAHIEITVVKDKLQARIHKYKYRRQRFVSSEISIPD